MSVELSPNNEDLDDWGDYPVDATEHAGDNIEIDFAIMEGRREPSRLVPIRRMARRAASPTARRRYQRAAAHRRTLKLWSALRTCCRGGRCRRRPRVVRHVVRAGDDAEGPPAARSAPRQFVLHLGDKNPEELSCSLRSHARAS